MGWVDPKTFPVDEIGKSLLSLEIGVPSPPVTTNEGFHILFLHEEKSGGAPTLETHWSELEGLALARKKGRRFNAWLKDASESIYVENFLIKK